MRPSQKRYESMAWVLLLFWLVANSILRFNLGLPWRLVSDDADWWVYFLRGVWMPGHLLPYRDVFSEYPQVPTLLFGLLRMPFLAQPLFTQYVEFSMVFSGLMLLALFFLCVMLEKYLPEGRKHLVFLLFLPGPLYFSYNRFDILPALMCFMALVLVRERMWLLVAALLAVATLTKWYPALLVPPILVYMFRRRERLSRMLFFCAVYGIVCLLILMPTFLGGGISAVLSPYRFHTARPIDIPSFPGLLKPLTDTLPFIGPDSGALTLAFVVLQFGFSLAAAFVRLDSFERLLNWCALTVIAFVLFSRIWSPQYLLWSFPFLIVVAKSRLQFVLILLYGIVPYIEFPTLFDIFGYTSVSLHFMACVNATVLMLILLSLARASLLESSHQKRAVELALPG